jgi:hypothetical protein
MTERQQRINEAARHFTEALLESYRAATDRTLSAQELNAQLTQDLFSAVINNLRARGEGTRSTAQKLAEQTHKGQEAAQRLARESVGVYVDFMHSLFFASPGSAEATKRAGERSPGER